MTELERLQVLTEVVREFKTAVLNEDEPEKTGSLILEVIQETGDTMLADFILQAYLRIKQPEVAVSYLDQATRYLYEQIDRILERS